MLLFQAHKQWSTRPADERFPTIQALYDATRSYYQTACEKTVAVADVRTEAIDGDVRLVGKRNNPALLTHWAFGQLAARIGAPASYLRQLPATLATQNLNYGLANLSSDRDATAQLLFHSNGHLLCRAFTSDKYSRIWNWEVAERLLNLEQYGWRPARPTFNSLGDDSPALYASDHDMFAFVMSDNHTVTEAGSDSPLYRGVIVENSEVGSSALKLTRFLFRAICGNHIIWGASKVMDISVRHVGDARNRWGLYQAEMRRYLESSASDDEAQIKSAKSRLIAATKEQVLDRLFGMRSLNISRKTLDAGYEACLPAEDGSPDTVWGMVQGLTRHSQTLQYADARTQVDRAAGRIMEANF